MTLKQLRLALMGILPACKGGSGTLPGTAGKMPRCARNCHYILQSSVV